MPNSPRSHLWLSIDPLQDENPSMLANWALQFTPRISLIDDRGLLLEIRGSLKLFGGLEGLDTRLRQGLDELGCAARVATAPTPLAARLLARAGVPARIESLAALQTQLARMPLEHLALPARCLEGLRAVGLRDCGEVLALPRQAFVRRHGAAARDYLDRLVGLKGDPQDAWEPPPVFDRRLELLAESDSCQALAFGFKRLCVELQGFLRGCDRGAMQLTARLCHADAPATQFSLGLSAPSRDAGHLLDLIQQRLERLQLPAPVRAIHLACDALAELKAPPADLLPQPGDAVDPQLIERLAARLGPEALVNLSTHADYRPERAFRLVAPGDGADTAPCSRPRPLWLLDAPKPADPTQLRLQTPPERLETGWWDQAPAGRDYHQALSPRGRRLWVYRVHGGGWFVHGVFA